MLPACIPIPSDAEILLIALKVDSLVLEIWSDVGLRIFPLGAVIADQELPVRERLSEDRLNGCCDVLTLGFVRRHADEDAGHGRRVSE